MTSSSRPDLFSQLPILGEIGAELDRILEDDVRHRERPATVARSGRWWSRRLRPLALVVALVIGGAAVALAATGVILAGSPVRPSGPVVATAGDGIPVVGASRLLALRVADPAGGLPWAIRVVRTTRSLVCVQVGRVDHGQLGQLGIDGAFGDDGRFHPLPADVLPDAAGPSGSDFESCTSPGSTFGQVSFGLEASAAANPPAGEGVAAGRREVSFGLLGPHAVSITYRSGQQSRNEPVVPGLGAYLVVQRFTAPQRNTSAGRVRCSDCLGGSSESDGDDLPYPQTDPAAPIGALTAITYSFAGRTCVDNAAIAKTGPDAINEFNDRIVRFRRACGLSEGPPPRPAPLPPAHEQLGVQLQVHDHVITGAEITFAAPIAVTTAGQSYSATLIVGERDTGSVGTSIDFARGARVRIPVERLLAEAATRSVTIEIDYLRSLPGPPGYQTAIVGTATIHEPPGTRPAPLPFHARTPGQPRKAQRLELLGLRAPDPAGGPPWGIRLAFSEEPLGTAVSIEIGRIADGRMGVIGEDNAFHNDGRFHPATAPADLMNPAQYLIGGSIRTPTLQNTNTFDLVLPAVASASPGCSTTALSDYADCPHHDRRTIVAGFVGLTARTVTIAGNGLHDTQPLTPNDHGFYLLVLDRPWNRRLRYTATVACADGRTATGPATPSEGTGTAYCPAR